MNIIVTGAGRGIGLEVCKDFILNPDNTIYAISRNIDALKALQDSFPNLVPLSFDLESNSFDEVVNQIGGNIDILINNAGLLINKAFGDFEQTDLERTMNVNFMAPFKLIQTLLPYFSEPAHIVNISSMGGFQGSSKFSGLSAYSSSKAALACLTECLAEELKPHNIKINCLCLGAVQTEMLDMAFPNYKTDMQPADISKFIVDFASQAYKYMNGKVIPVSLNTP